MKAKVGMPINNDNGVIYSLNLYIFAAFSTTNDIDQTTETETSTEGFRIPVYMVTEESLEIVEPNREIKIKTSLVAVEFPDDEASSPSHLLSVLGREPFIKKDKHLQLEWLFKTYKFEFGFQA